MSRDANISSLVWAGVLLLLAACVPLVANGYWMSIALTIAVYCAVDKLGTVFRTNALHIAGNGSLFRGWRISGRHRHVGL